MTFHLGRLTRRTVFRFLTFAACSLALAGGVHAQGNIDTDQQLATPVPHRYIHGRLGDAEFQIALPDNWNGKLLIGARGFSGDELASGAFKTVGPAEGLRLRAERPGLVPVRHHRPSRGQVLRVAAPHPAADELHEVGRRRHYGRSATRTFMVGGSNGGHNTKMMVEDYPGEYDGGVAGYGITSHLEWMGSRTRFLRNFDVFAPRIADIIAKRTASPNWNPDGEPLSPPLTNAQLEALRNIYNMPARVRVDRLQHRHAGRLGVPLRAAGNYTANLGYAQTSVAKFDRFYDPDGNGELSDAEIKAWDPNFSPPPGRERPASLRQHRQPEAADHHRARLARPDRLARRDRCLQAAGRAALRRRGRPQLAGGLLHPAHGARRRRVRRLAVGASSTCSKPGSTWHQSGGKSGSLPPNTLVGELGSYPRD